VGTSKRLIPTPNARGTISYRAPELLIDPDHPVYSNKSDIWGLACIFCELVMGRKVFLNDFEVSQIYSQNLPVNLPPFPQCPVRGTWVDSVTLGFMALLAGMLSKSTEIRPPAEQVREIVEAQLGWCI
jgi:serine/threonine protein kinase